MILLIVDGVRFQEHDFTIESDLEGLVEAHSRDIFGTDSLYFGKKKIASVLGTGSVPDGYAICFQGSPQWYVIEIELSSHSRSHMLDQFSRFFSGLENESARSSLVDFMETELHNQPELEAKVRK